MSEHANDTDNESLVETESRASLNRRAILKGSAAVAVGLSVPAAAFQAFLAKPADARHPKVDPNYGPLSEVADESTGLPLLRLPKGFQYASFGITGDPMSDGSPTPGAHDGMAVVKEQRGKLTLVRNHEQGSGTPFGTSKTPVFDAAAAGGTTNLVFDTRRGKLVEHWASLTGTIRNCAGGYNPLTTSWVTCEETTDTGHGYLFNVPAFGKASAKPIRDAGRFSHEAIAVDPRTGIIYETEDEDISGLYRYIPRHRNKPESGGKLQMARVRGSNQPVNLNGGNAGRNTDAAALGLPAGGALEIGQDFRIDWVDIDDPEGTTEAPVAQGIKKGGCFFSRGEGAWYSDGSIFFISTDGGEATVGQVWEYDIHRSKLKLIYESEDEFALNNPDNITVAPSGALLFCEDGGGVNDSAGNLRRGEQMVGLSTDGDLFPFAENNVVIPADKPIGGRTGDLRDTEWAGATFSPDGDWLFANLQTPGITFAITGPWKRGAFGRGKHDFSFGFPFGPFGRMDG